MDSLNFAQVPPVWTIYSRDVPFVGSGWIKWMCYSWKGRKFNCSREVPETKLKYPSNMKHWMENFLARKFEVCLLYPSSPSHERYKSLSERGLVTVHLQRVVQGKEVGERGYPSQVLRQGYLPHAAKTRTWGTPSPCLCPPCCGIYFCLWTSVCWHF